MKTHVFTLLLRGWDIRNQQIFNWKMIKNHACNPNLFFDASNIRNCQKEIETVSGGTPQIHQKSKKIPPGTFQVPSVCICDPLDIKMMSKGYPRTSNWSQNGHLGTLKEAKNQQNQIIKH